MTTVIIHSNLDRGEYFFSTDHCQGPRAPETYPAGFVATSFHLPHRVVSRPTFPSGWIETAADVVKVYFHSDREIPNPDPMYQPKVEEREYDPRESEYYCSSCDADGCVCSQMNGD